MYLLKFCLPADGTCVKTCKDGFYGDEKQECEPCHPMCRTCGGPEYDDCDSCEDDLFLKKGQCVSKSKTKCPDGKFLNGMKAVHSENSFTFIILIKPKHEYYVNVITSLNYVF